VPIAVLLVTQLGLTVLLRHGPGPIPAWLVGVALVVLAVAVLLVALGADLGVGLLVAALSPIVVVVGAEARRRREPA